MPAASTATSPERLSEGGVRHPLAW